MPKADMLRGQKSHTKILLYKNELYEEKSSKWVLTKEFRVKMYNTLACSELFNCDWIYLKKFK